MNCEQREPLWRQPPIRLRSGQALGCPSLGEARRLRSRQLLKDHPRVIQTHAWNPPPKNRLAAI